MTVNDDVGEAHDLLMVVTEEISRDLASRPLSPRLSTSGSSMPVPRPAVVSPGVSRDRRLSLRILITRQTNRPRIRCCTPPSRFRISAAVAKPFLCAPLPRLPPSPCRLLLLLRHDFFHFFFVFVTVNMNCSVHCT